MKSKWKPETSTLGRHQNEKIWNSQIISFFLSQNVVKISILWTFQLWEKTALPWNLAHPASQPEMPRQKQKLRDTQRRNTPSWRGRGANAVSVCPGLLQCPVPAQCLLLAQQRGRGTTVLSCPVPSWGGSGEPGDPSVLSYSRLDGAAGPNAAFVAQHCPAERLQLLLNACQSTLGLHYSWGFAWCHSKTAAIYPLPYFQFALLPSRAHKATDKWQLNQPQ